MNVACPHLAPAYQCSLSVGAVRVVSGPQMKVRPLRAHESSIEHFGQSGQSLHGTLLVQSAAATSPLMATPGHDGAGGSSTRAVYIRDVYSALKNQDTAALVLTLVAVAYELSVSFPVIKSVSLVSDRGAVYGSGGLKLMIPFIFGMFDIQVTQYLHNVEGDGKVGEH